MMHLTDNLTLAIPHCPITPPPSRQADRTSQSRQGVGEFPTVSTTLNVPPFLTSARVPTKYGIYHQRLNGKAHVKKPVAGKPERSRRPWPGEGNQQVLGLLV